MKIAIFGFDVFGEKIASMLNRREVFIVVMSDSEEKRAKELLYETIKIEKISDEEIKNILEFDIAIATLKEEDSNLFLCLTLKELYPDKILMAKVSSKDNEYKYKLAGVNKIINPYEIISNRILTILKKPLTLKVIETIIFQDNNLAFDEIIIEKNSFIDGKYIKDVYKDITSLYNLLIIGIVDKEISENVQFIAKGHNHKIDAGDILIVVGDIDEIERFKNDLKGNR